MDIYSSAFTLARTPNDVDSLIHSIHGCSLSHYPLSPASSSFSISGPQSHVLLARAILLSHSLPQVRSSLKLPRPLILDMPFSSSPALNQHVRAQLDQIASHSQAHIAVVNSLPTSLNDPFPAIGLQSEKLCELVISGDEHAVDLARVRLLVMLDELSGLHSESIEIDYKLLPIIAGRKRSTLQSIQEETATNIYFPSSLHLASSPDQFKSKNTVWISGEFYGVQRARDMLFQIAAQKSSLVSKDTALLPRKLDFLLLHHSDDLKSLMADTASFILFPILGSSTTPLVTVFSDNRVNVAKAMKAVMQLATQFFVASYWLLPTHFNTLLPPPTSPLQLSLTLNKLLPPSASPFPPPPPFLSTTSTSSTPSSTSSGGSTNAGPFTTIIQQISIASGAEVVFKGMCFELHGLEPQVRKAVGMIMELDIVKSFHHEVRFQLELSNEHRDFISGKKNGKINKITQSFSTATTFPQTTPSIAPKIKFETLNDSNFLIDLSSPSPLTTLSALTLLMEELPAEISFHVPEVYHKRIIGVGGRSIQRIMKRFGVYVKFLSGDEVRGGGGTGANNSPLGGGMNAASSPGNVVGDRYTERDWEMEDNVVARTPAKNAVNLEHLKSSVMELVASKDKDFTTETLSIPRRYHRTILGEMGILIHDIEQKTNCRVRFPDKESGSDVVVIYGPESQVGITAAMLLDHVPFEADMIVPPHPDLVRVSCSVEFNNLIEHIKRELQVSITPNFKRQSSGASSSSSSSPGSTTMNGNATATPSPIGTDSTQAQPDYSFKFRCQRSNTDFLPTAREMLEQFLIKHQVFGPPSSTNTTTSTASATATTAAAAATAATTGGSSSGSGMVHRRTDSFADAFPHFESRVLSGNVGGTGFGSILSRSRGHESMDMGRPDLSLISERRLRLANSSPDVKALFNAPAYIYNLEALEAASVGSSGDDLGFGEGGGGGGGYSETYGEGAYESSVGEGSSATTGGGALDLDYWNPTPLTPITTPRSRQVHDALKRGSDSLLEAKLKEQHQMALQTSKTRSLTNRAQSLDLTHSLALARIAEGSGGGGVGGGGVFGSTSSSGSTGGSGRGSTSGSPALGNIGLGPGGTGAGGFGYSQLQRYYHHHQPQQQQQQHQKKKIPQEQEYEYEYEERDAGGGLEAEYPDSPRTAGTGSTSTTNPGANMVGGGDEYTFNEESLGLGLGSSTTTTTTPSFPSVYGPPGSTTVNPSRSSLVGYGNHSTGFGNGSALGGLGGWMTTTTAATATTGEQQQQQQQQQSSQQSSPSQQTTNTTYHPHHTHHLSHQFTSTSSKNTTTPPPPNLTAHHHHHHHHHPSHQSHLPVVHHGIGHHRHTVSSSPAIPLRKSSLGASAADVVLLDDNEEDESVNQASRVMSNLGL